jgi:hypothetical protein
LISKGLSRSCYALVDSGADDCVFPASYAARVGLDIAQGKKYPFAGVGSQQVAYFFDIEIALPGTPIKYAVPVGFTSALDRSPFGYGLLGQNGFFDRFKISFDRAHGVFTLDAP